MVTRWFGRAVAVLAPASPPRPRERTLSSSLSSDIAPFPLRPSSLELLLLLAVSELKSIPGVLRGFLACAGALAGLCGAPWALLWAPTADAPLLAGPAEPRARGCVFECSATARLTASLIQPDCTAFSASLRASCSQTAWAWLCPPGRVVTAVAGTRSGLPPWPHGGLCAFPAPAEE